MTTKKQKRELEVGLANNAFGAAFGAYGTKLAYDKAKKVDPVASRTGRLISRIPKMTPKRAVATTGTALVGGSLLNAGLDAQSAYYFGRERAKVYGREQAAKERVNKRGDGVGFNIAKRGLYENRETLESERQRRAGRAEVLGGMGAGALGLSGAGLLTHSLSRGGIKGAKKNSKDSFNRIFRPDQLKVKDKMTGRRKYAAYGAGLLLAAPVAAASTKRFSRESREPWE